MADPRRRSCRTCGRHDSQVGPISWRGFCGDCAREALIANNDGIHLKTGPAYARQQFGIVRAAVGPRIALALKQAGVFALDDAEPSE